MFNGKRYSGTCLMRKPSCPHHCDGPGKWCHHYTVDFVKLAEAYGAIGIRITKPEEVEPALKEAGKSTNRPVFLDFIIEREANVWPMVAPGASLSQIQLGKENR
jgi:acetolactate synthase I/II/III large subunit